MKIRKAVKEDNKNFNQLAEYCFGDPYNIDSLAAEMFDPDITTVVEEDGKLVGGYIVYPFDVTYGGATVKMGGISCVTMDVHVRYKGYAKKMLTRMIEDMHKEGMVFSALGAFDLQFYRKLGWEVAYDRYLMELEIEQFRDYLKNDYTVEKHYDIPIDSILNLQIDFAKKYNGYVHRTKEYWQDFEKYYKKGKWLLGTVSLKGEVRGYIIYKLSEEKKMYIREIVYSDIDALKALLGFIYRHKHNIQRKKVVFEVATDFPVRMMVEDQYKVETKLQVLMMNRVVDVKKAFEQGSYPRNCSMNIFLKINDPIADWNNGVWNIFVGNGKIEAEKTSIQDKPDAEIDIQTLAQILLGYASGKTLLDLGKISVETEDSREFIEKVFLEKVTYMNNRF